MQKFVVLVVFFISNKQTSPQRPSNKDVENDALVLDVECAIFRLHKRRKFLIQLYVFLFIERSHINGTKIDSQPFERINKKKFAKLQLLRLKSVRCQSLAKTGLGIFYSWVESLIRKFFCMNLIFTS